MKIRGRIVSALLLVSMSGLMESQAMAGVDFGTWLQRILEHVQSSPLVHPDAPAAPVRQPVMRPTSASPQLSRR
jgi:hypothetical protein